LNRAAAQAEDADVLRRSKLDFAAAHDGAKQLRARNPAKAVEGYKVTGRPAAPAGAVMLEEGYGGSHGPASLVRRTPALFHLSG
jgi:hypothetical protein